MGLHSSILVDVEFAIHVLLTSCVVFLEHWDCTRTLWGYECWEHFLVELWSSEIII